MPDRLETHNKDILGTDVESDENRNLRLKGNIIIYLFLFARVEDSKFRITSTFFGSIFLIT